MEKCKCGSYSVIHKEFHFHDIIKCKVCGYLNIQSIEDCCRLPHRIVTIEHFKIDNQRLYYQCLNCGGADRKKPLSFSKYGEEIRLEFNKEEYDAKGIRRREEYQNISREVRKVNYENSKAFTYHQYLQGIEWKEKRKLVLQRDGYLCRRCLTNKAEEVHHKTYLNVFNEPIEDLISFCPPCHALEHIEINKAILRNKVDG